MPRRLTDEELDQMRKKELEDKKERLTRECEDLRKVCTGIYCFLFTF